jgi:histidyl-tRNA synthetase
LILLAEQFLSSLGIDPNIKLNINTLGDKESRQKYRDALVEYLSSYKDDLSDDSKIRLQKNPLRILDSKDKRDREIISDAPKISDHLTDDAKKFFENVISYIEQKLSIELVINEKIVRGLDYYNHTVFEFISEDDELGAQNTILAGGRYDGLVKQMGGADTPAVGFAAGIERLMMLAKTDDKSTERRIAIISDFDDLAVKYADILRADKNIICEIIYSGNFSKKVKKADKMNATEILFCFEDKLELKNLETGEQKQLNIEDI